MSRGNPHYSAGLRERRVELLTRLLAESKENWLKIKARFAFEYGLTESKVHEYYMTLKNAGLLDKVLSNQDNN
jgi:hypothetical protein